ncbi:MAG: hypothetical protein ACFFD1_02620, partial [Candidatus Thorarchaeota archaeon]
RSKAGKVHRTLDNLDSLKGAKPSEIEKLIPKNWVKSPLKKGDGMKFINPSKKGESIMIEKGWSNAQDLIHSGPYLRITKDGNVIRIPLKGNPTLK